jgi:hypothetical protein
MRPEGVLYRSARNRLVARLGDVRGYVDDLLEIVRRLVEVKEVPSARTLQTIGTLLNRLISEQVPPIQQALRDSDELDAIASGAVGRLVGAITEARIAADLIDGLPGDPPLATVQSSARATVTALEKVDACVTDLIIAWEVRDRLHELAVGRALDFKAEYATRIPSHEKREEILDDLAEGRLYLDEGVVDVAAEKIWRRSSSRTYRALTYLSPLFFAALGALVLWGLSLTDVDSALEEPGDLLGPYLLVLLGMGAHLLIENVKQTQVKQAQVIAIGGFLDWLHLRWVALGASFIPVLATVIFLRLEGVSPDSAMFLFAGYSIDSIAGLALTRFGTSVKSGVATVTAFAGRPGGSTTTGTGTP